MRFDLVGVDGNAFNVMGYVVGAMRRSGFTSDQITDYRKQCMSGDYDNLLAISFDMIEKCNERMDPDDDE
jgi:hypothetical protein